MGFLSAGNVSFLCYLEVHFVTASETNRPNIGTERHEITKDGERMECEKMRKMVSKMAGIWWDEVEVVGMSRKSSFRAAL